MADYTSLKNKAQQVRDEVQICANTAYRVGDAIMGTVEAAEANANAIAAETERATTKETNLQNQISEDGNNIQRIQDEIEDLPSIRDNIEANANAIATETTRATEAETELQDAIATESTRAQTKETELQRYINDASERITENTDAIATETTRALTREGQLMDNINRNGTDIQTIQDEIGDLPSIRSNIEANTNGISGMNLQIQENTEDIYHTKNSIHRLKALIDNGTICYIIGESWSGGQIVQHTGEYAQYYYRSELISIELLGLRYSPIEIEEGYVGSCQCFDKDRVYISSFTVQGDKIGYSSLPSNAVYLAFSGYKNTSDGTSNVVKIKNFAYNNLRKNISHASMQGVTENPEVNKYILELFLEGLDSAQEYQIYTVSNTEASHFVQIQTYNSEEGTQIVARSYSTDLERTVIQVEERNESGISGYIVVDWKRAPLGTNNTFSRIIKEKVITKDTNPIIMDYLRKIEFDSTQMINDALRNFVEVTEETDQAILEVNKYVNYSTGNYVSAGESTTANAYLIPVDDLSYKPCKVRCYCGFIDSVPAAIAFYTSTTPSKTSYIPDYATQSITTTGDWFEAEVPPDAKLIVVSNIAKQLASPRIFLQAQNKLYSLISTSPYPSQIKKGGYILWADGTYVEAGSHWSVATVDVQDLHSISAIIHQYDNNTAAIAFYDNDGTYMQSDSIRGIKTSGGEFFARVPNNAKYAKICSAASIPPVISCNEIGRTVRGVVSTLATMQPDIHRLDVLNVATYPVSSPCDYHHLFIDKIKLDSEVTIPSQSVFDVVVAAKLGFKMIEVNVLITSDGVPVTGHQVGTGVLQTLTNLAGEPTAVTIPDITFDELRTNYRYKSIYPQYRTPITSLEEFLRECKKYNLIPFVQCVSQEVVQLTESIVGNAYVAYGADRAWTSATIFEYRKGTIDEIVNRCKTIGKPYIFGVSSSTLNAFTDTELIELCQRVHAEGCWLAWAGCYHSNEQNQRYRQYLDANASGWDVPDFSSAMYEFVGNSVRGFEEFNITEEYLTADNIVNLPSTESIWKDVTPQSILAKASLHIHYKGNLHINFGGHILDDIESDGNREIILTSILENESYGLYIKANADTEIYSLTYRVQPVI